MTNMAFLEQRLNIYNFVNIIEQFVRKGQPSVQLSPVTATNKRIILLDALAPLHTLVPPLFQCLVIIKYTKYSLVSVKHASSLE